MKRTFRTSLLATALLTLSGAAMAQSNVDIGLFQNNGVLEVKVRPEADFSGIFSSLVFTIRWDANSGGSLGPIGQEEGTAAYMGVAKSGNVREAGAFRYMVYAGFGMSPMSAQGVNWLAGEEYTIATIPVTGQGSLNW